MQFIDDAEFQVAIDLDAGGRIASLKWKDLEFTVPFRGGVANYGWYAMAPWAGRIKDGIIKSPSGEAFQLPTQLDPPNALHGLGSHHHGRKLAQDVHFCTYQSLMVEQRSSRQLKY